MLSKVITEFPYLNVGVELAWRRGERRVGVGGFAGGNRGTLVGWICGSCVGFTFGALLGCIGIIECSVGLMSCTLGNGAVGFVDVFDGCTIFLAWPMGMICTLGTGAGGCVGVSDGVLDGVVCSFLSLFLKISCNCSRTVRVVVPFGGRMLFFTVDVSVLVNIV